MRTKLKPSSMTFVKRKKKLAEKSSILREAVYMEYGNINAAYSHFVELITGIIDELAPAKKIRVKKDSQEWMDQEVLEGI